MLRINQNNPPNLPANLVFFADFHGVFVHRRLFVRICGHGPFYLNEIQRKEGVQISSSNFLSKKNRRKKLKFKPAPSIAPSKKNQHLCKPFGSARCFFEDQRGRPGGGNGKFVGIWFEMGVEGRKDVSQVEGSPVGYPHTLVNPGNPRGDEPASWMGGG